MVPRLPFDSKARFVAALWRGVDVDGQRIKEGEELPRGLDPAHLRGMYAAGLINVKPTELPDDDDEDEEPIIVKPASPPAKPKRRKRA